MGITSAQLREIVETITLASVKTYQTICPTCEQVCRGEAAEFLREVGQCPRCDKISHDAFIENREEAE